MAIVCSSALTQAVSAGEYEPPVAQEFQAGDWLLRLRATYLKYEDGAKQVNVAGVATFSGSVVDVDDDFIPEVDFTYFLTKNIAIEAICCLVNVDIDASGAFGAALPGLGLTNGTQIVKTWVIPATVLIQYHFDLGNGIKPYLGVGPTYAIFFNEKVGTSVFPAATAVNVKNSWGVTFQAGADVHLRDNWHLNFDVKYMHLEVDAKWDTPGLGNGTIRATDIEVNPWVISLGIGYKF